MAQDFQVPATGNLLDRVIATPAVQSLARRLEAGRALPCAGVHSAAQPFLAVVLRWLLPHRPIVVVTDHLKTQETFQQDLETWAKLETRNSKAEGNSTPETESPSAIFHPPCSPLFYPAWEVLPHEGKLPHADVISERLQTLVSLLPNPERETGNAELIVTSVAALLQRTFSPDDLRQRIRPLARGDRADPLDLVEWLEAQGYEPEAQVTQKGDIALRGGILDIWPPTSPWPVRLEFFGDELESLREFNPLTQVSRGEIAVITLPPAGELGILKSGMRSAEREMEAPLALATMLDYLPSQAIVLCCEPELLAERATEYAQQVPADDPFFVSWPEFLAQVDRRGMTRLEVSEGEMVSVLPMNDPNTVPSALAETKAGVALETGWLFTGLDAFRPLGERAPDPQIAEAQRSEFFNQLHRWLRQGNAVHVFCNNDGERQRFEEIWAEHGFDTRQRAAGILPAEQTDVNAATVELSMPALHLGTLSRGFLCDEAKLVVVTDAEIFGRYRVQRPRRLKSPHAAAMRSALEIDFADLEEGDLVVHLQHGIGRYLGLKMLPAVSSHRQPAAVSRQSETECLVIEYAPRELGDEPPRLYVPVSEAHLVSKYVGAGKARPPLNTLGGTRWAKAKEHAEKAVRDVAAELLQIQAARESQPGHAFKPDAPWQREFEGAFIFEETPDQVKAIGETKADMERPKPMDRLICGDVGFGKTEVAIRAAFKAVMDGRQVAVLVPTTVLAQQHFNTFRERMADYPVRIELLSRFRTRGAQQRVVRDLTAGAVDIVIGTHRLIQSDIVFKDLGLVVIDEEQRFGVLHKEKFKRLRTLVDVLTLSATPIPRTLYLALTGARDMSTIQTPPHSRRKPGRQTRSQVLAHELQKTARIVQGPGRNQIADVEQGQRREVPVPGGARAPGKELQVMGAPRVRVPEEDMVPVPVKALGRLRVRQLGRQDCAHEPLEMFVEEHRLALHHLQPGGLGHGRVHVHAGDPEGVTARGPRQFVQQGPLAVPFGVGNVAVGKPGLLEREHSGQPQAGGEQDGSHPG